MEAKQILMRALVIEDEPTLQVFYQRVLQKAQYAVDIARDGQQALLALSSVDAPHLVILDIRLPDTNGIEVLNYITKQEHLQNTCVIVATASAEFERYTQSVSTAEFLLKPVRPAQILKIAEREAQRHMA